MTHDHYAVLELEAAATEAEVKQAYRRLARAHHPDLNDGGDSAERFRLVAEAYRVLSDPSARTRYDRTIPGRHPEPPSDGPPNPFQEAGMRWAREGRDVLALLELRLEEAAAGGCALVDVDGPVRCAGCAGDGLDPSGATVRCWTCSGTGRVTYANRLGEQRGVCLTCGGEREVATEPCPLCTGEGTVIGRRQVEVSYPAGVGHGATLELAGSGGPGGRGGRPGDLLVFVRILPHPFFTRSGNHLGVVVPIHYAEAARGAEIRVPTLDGPASLVVPPGTQGGTVLTLSRRGIRTGDGVGDLRVTVQIAVPTDLVGLEEAIDRLAPERPEDLRSQLFLR